MPLIQRQPSAAIANFAPVVVVPVDVVAPDISAQESSIKAAALWVEDNKSTIPDYVYSSVLLLLKLRAELGRVQQKAAKLLALFRLELGVTPKSEAGKTKDPKPLVAQTDKERIAALKARRAKLLKEIRRYEDRLGKHQENRQEIAPPSVPVPADPEFQRTEEKVFEGDLGDHSPEESRLAVNKMDSFENPRGLHSVSDERTRHEFGVTTKTITLHVETVTDPRTGKSVTASTDEIGPPNSQATWTGIANAITAVIGYAIPVNRLASMLKTSCPYFTCARLCFHLKMAAEYFEPIYTCLGGQLSDVDVLQGDDTKARVVEINKALKDGGELSDPPEDSLIAKVAGVFGRVFPKKNGKGTKRSLNVSVVIGKTHIYDARSYIFFFRSHLGTLGDLLSKILEMRSPKKKDLTILTDLATTNLVSQKLQAKFNITQAGCGPHARRPFWRWKDTDQRLCYWMLSAFLVLEQIEDRIDELGRTRDRIIRYRGRYSRKVWAIIRNRCESVLRGETVYGHRWPKTSELYVACQYIVTHYQKLTRYIEDPRLPSNNNLSERVLRWDKIMQDASKFRKTEAGRLNVDILRTIVHTCSAAKVDLRNYLLFVFKNRDAISASPERYTPYAYALMLDAARTAN